MQATINVKAEYINTSEDYKIMWILKSPTLVYGKPKAKNCKGIAFGNPEIMRQIANQLLQAADALDINE